MSVDLKRTFFWLTAVNIALIGIYLAAVWLPLPWPIQRLFDLNAEATVVSWYTGSLLLLGGVLLLLAGSVAGRDDRWLGRLLVLFGSVFVFLSADEVAAIHEQITLSLKEYPGLPRFEGDHGLWIPIYAVAGAVVCAASVPLWRRLREVERRGTTLLALGAAVLAAAVLIEIAGYGETPSLGKWAAYHAQVAAEEGLEIFGATLLLVGAAAILAAVQATAAAVEK